MNFCECGGEVDIRYGGHGAKFYAECRECGKTVDLKAVDRLGAIQEWNNRSEEKTMNLIPKICELLGVEIGEEFKVENDVCLHRFTENGLEYKVCGVWSACARLNLVLNGTEKIIKLPFEPKEHQTYWHVFWYPNKKYVPHCAPRVWLGYDTDYINITVGNCFRTEAEAEAHKYEIYEKLTGKKWEE